MHVPQIDNFPKANQMATKILQIQYKNPFNHDEIANNDPFSDKVTLEFELHGENRILCRNSSEKLQKVTSRIQLLLDPTLYSKHPSKKKTKKKTTNKLPNQTTHLPTSPPTDLVTEPPRVLFYDGNDLIIPTTLPLKEVVARAKLLQINEQTYLVRVNTPRVKCVRVAEPLLQGIPSVASCIVEFGKVVDCEWQWFRLRTNKEEGDTNTIMLPNDGSDNKNSSVLDLVSRERCYVPNVADIGSCFQIVCQIKDVTNDNEIVASSFTTSPVCPGPCRNIFNRRKKIGTVKASSDNNRFRVMTYNILFDKFATSNHAKTVMFPFSKDIFMREMYRSQLVFMEILENQPDIICLQEMGKSVYHKYFEPSLEYQGFKGVYKGKVGSSSEGGAIFYRESCFSEVDYYGTSITYLAQSLPPDSQIFKILKEFPEVQKALLTVPSIFQLLVLRHVVSQRHLIIVNIHAYYRDDSNFVRLLQIALVIQEIEKKKSHLIQLGVEVEVIFSGDFNSKPNTSPVEFLVNGKVDSLHPDWKDARFFKWSKSSIKTSNVANSLIESPIKCFSHTFQFKSACGFPEFTNFVISENFQFIETLDYIMFDSSTLEVDSVFPFFNRQDLTEEKSVPSSKFPSDHIALCCDFQFVSK